MAEIAIATVNDGSADTELFMFPVADIKKTEAVSEIEEGDTLVLVIEDY